MIDNEVVLHEAWRKFLGEFEWNHACTLTTRFPYSDAALMAELRHRFIRRLSKMTQHRTAWFAAAEWTHVGRAHLHVLLGGTAALSIKQIERAWNAGHSRMTILRDSGDAVRYVVKELGRYPDNFDLSRRWIPMPHRRSAA